MGNTCAERANIPGYGTGTMLQHGWFGLERERWSKLFGLSDDQLEFFEIHGPADIEHSNLGWNTVAEYAEKLSMEDHVVRACRENLVVWETYLNGIGAAGDAEDKKQAA
jgi:pyrroloquinoline quinone (PQQ) biosynthesis protein C